jgi:5-methylcytosine-specific restriction endonuclease McrA
LQHFKTRPRFTIRTRGKLKRHAGTRCPYCNIVMDKGSTRYRPTRDHMIAKTRGGQDVVTNITIVCHRCNQEKGALLPDEFVAWRAGTASRIDKGVGWRRRWTYACLIALAKPSLARCLRRDRVLTNQREPI